MAQEREKLVDLYAPYGTQVTVNEDRAAVLKERGYTTSKPRNPKLSNEARGGRQAENSQALTDAEAEIARLKAELEAAKATPAGGDFPPPKN